MADKTSLIQLSEAIQRIDFLKDLPNVPDDEQALFEQLLSDLQSRQASKIDAIVAMIKHSERYTEALETELKELQAQIKSWKRHREVLSNIFKYAYQSNLIDSKPTGIKYQATLRKTKPRLVDNFEHWTDQEKEEFGVKKTTITTRIKDNILLDKKEEILPDKDQVRTELEKDTGKATLSSELIKSYALTVERRKRLTN